MKNTKNSSGLTNQTNMKLIRNTGPSLARFIEEEFNLGTIQDYSEDGWVLVNKEWLPIEVYIKRNKSNVNFH